MKKSNLFYIFLFINSVLWCLLGLLRNVIGDDALEAISWGELVDFGTNKHPPLSGWLMGGAYNLFQQHDFAAYFLGSACVLTGFVFIYKLAKFFLDEDKSIAASLIMTPCYYFTFTLFYENFNCNILSMAFWPMITYYFYKSLKEDKICDWILFGISSALGFLTKYQVVFLFLVLFIYLIAVKREQFKKRGMYIAIITGFLVILPHVIWLFKHDFFSFIYMTDRVEIGIHNTPQFLLKFGRIVFPVKFIFDQILCVMPCILMFLLTALFARNISFCKTSNKSELLFISLICFGPMLLQASTGLFSNSRIMGMWGSMMVSFCGLFLMYVFPIKFKEKTFIRLIILAYSFALIWLGAMFVFMQLQTKLHVSFPYQKVIPEINSIWDEETNNSELKYVGGNGEYVFKINVYNPRHPKVVLETFGHENPWISPDEVINSGIIIFGKTEDELISQTKDTVTLLPENYKIIPRVCSFEITNKLGKSKKFELYYTIIPPVTFYKLK